MSPSVVGAGGSLVNMLEQAKVVVTWGPLSGQTDRQTLLKTLNFTTLLAGDNKHILLLNSHHRNENNIDIE